MSEIPNTITRAPIIFSSSLRNDWWHGQEGRSAFESWHFDALSDDGREALVISFHDNYPFSPRYFQHERTANSDTSVPQARFPAVCLTYSVDGKTVLRSANEFRADEFSAQRDAVGCQIGSSSFRVDAAEYGSGFLLQIDLLTLRGRRITAELEWLSIESDLLEVDGGSEAGNAMWNLVAPRSDVSGRITLIGRRGKTRRIVHFRGTGYHDHFRSGRSLEETVGSRCWGRAHFVDSTAVFHNYGENLSRLFLVRDGSIHEREAKGDVQNLVRDRYGLKIPRRLSFVSDDNIRLRVKPVKVIQSGLCKVKMLSEMTLMLRDGKPRKTLGLTEFVSPGRLKNPLFRLISDLRIGKNGKSPLI